MLYARMAYFWYYINMKRLCTSAIARSDEPVLFQHTVKENRPGHPQAFLLKNSIL